MTTTGPSPAPARIWVASCLFLVFCMVVLGGSTRLTESGLSIVEWKLVSGVVPPIGDEAWQHEFAEYRTSPQYAKFNRGMNVSDFRRIYWLEYLHRLLGRLVGLAFVVPLLVFALTRRAPVWLIKRMALGTLLVVAQGAVGWLMVKSGLKDVPWVSPYRLALHLSLAVSLVGLLTITLCRLCLRPVAETAAPASRPLAAAALAAVSLQIVIGAFVAGLDAGLTYNTFPLMDGDFFPRGAFLLTPWIRNLTESIPLVQFVHRWWAFLTAGLIWLAAAACFVRPHGRTARMLAGSASGLVFAQIGLGIATLVHAVPVGLGVLHQATAVLLFAFIAALCYVIRRAGRSHAGIDVSSVSPVPA